MHIKELPQQSESRPAQSNPPANFLPRQKHAITASGDGWDWIFNLILDEIEYSISKLTSYRGQKRCLTPLRYVHKIVGIGTHPKNASRILWRRDNKPCKVFLRTRSTIPTVATPTKFGREHDFFTVTSENASCSLNIVRHFFCNSRFLTPVAWVVVCVLLTCSVCWLKLMLDVS